MKNIIKNFIEIINIIIFDFIKPLTIRLYEVIVNIVFTVATSVLNLAFDILYIVNPSYFHTPEETEEEQITNKKIGYRK